MRPARAALLLTAAALPLAAQARSAPINASGVKPIAYTQRTLANGLRVYAIRDTGTANVAVQVWYDVGGKDDPKGRSGFAHLFEHLMFKATKNLPDESFDRLTEDVGGYNNASTNADYTNYFEVIPANHLQRLLFAEAERMANLAVNDVAFKSERQVVQEELRSRVLAQPYGKLFYVDLPEVSYSVHPYARPVIGSIENLDAASLDDVRAFHAIYYRPDNAVLVVAGNFDPALLNKWVDQYFAPIARPDRPIPRVTVTEPMRAQPAAYTDYQPNTPLPAALISYQIPPDRDADNAPLAVLNAVLSAGESSRLYQSLVYNQQIAQSANTFFDSRQDKGEIAVYAIMAGGKTADQGIAALKAEIARLRDAPVSAAELSEAKNQILTDTIRSRETADGKASAIAQAVIIDGDARAADRQLSEIAAVTAADVQRVARKYLGDNQAAIVRYLPAESAPAGARPSPIAVPATVQTPDFVPPSNVPVIVPAAAGQRVLPPPPGAPVAARLPTPVETRLANGMRLIVVEKHELPIVTASAVTLAGAAADPKGRAGLGDLTATLMTKGTATRSATDIARQVESLGGAISSDADWDGSSVDVTVKSDQLTKAMPILADVVRNPVFAQTELDRARAQAIDAVEVSLKNPAQLSGLVAARAVFGGLPYGHPADGTPTSLKAITRDEVRHAYAGTWSPDRTTLIVVGDITVAQARSLAEQGFGSWKTAPAAAPVAGPPPGYPAPRVIVVDLPGAGQAGVVVARPGIARSDPAFYPAAVANATLGGGYSSRLNEEIRVKRGLSYGASSSIAARRAPGPIAASTQTKNPSAPEVVQLIVGEMRKMGSVPTSAAELDTRKAILVGGFGRAAETTGGISNIIGNYVVQNVPLGELKSYTGSVQAVSPATMQATAARLLDPAKASIVVVGDAKLFLPELRKAYPKLEVIKAADLDLDTPALK